MLLDIIVYIVLALCGCFLLIPIGNERSTVRRLPWVTFSILAANVIIYYVTLPSTIQQHRDLTAAQIEVVMFVQENSEILADEKVRDRVRELAIFNDELDTIETQLKQDGNLAREYQIWLRGADATRLQEEFQNKLGDLRTAREAHLWYKYGLAPNGTWQLHQLFTAAFLHASTFHLFFNLIFFFAVGFSLEDLWGRGLFIAFYLLSAAGACLPDLINPSHLPTLGASGAVSATMGAFLVRLHRTKVKIAWVTLFFSIPFMLLGRKPFGVIKVAAYIYMPFYFILEVLNWYYSYRYGGGSIVAHWAHLAGFGFGAAFAWFVKASGTEERVIDPKIEAKVSFSGSPVVTSALEMLDRGEVPLAERKLKVHLAKHPNDPAAILALIQVYQRTLDYEQLNEMYGRLIRYHLEKGDKEAAIYAYDNLLSAFPDHDVAVKIPIRDWLSLCEYLIELQMNREAAVECERLVMAYPEEPLAVRACVQGAEAALAALETQRALRLFEQARTMNPPSPLYSRIETGLEKCRTRLDNRPTWVKQPKKGQDLSRDVDEQNVQW